jgi:hypothetical protein
MNTLSSSLMRGTAAGLALSVSLFSLCSFSLQAASLPISVTQEAKGGFKVEVEGKPFASYVVDQANKPYFWPVYGPTGKAMTRAFPMQEVAGEQRDHHHHRGITFGHEGGGLQSWKPSKKGEGEEAVKAQGGGDTWSEAGSYESLLKNKKSSQSAKVRVAGLARIVHREYRTLKSEGNRVEVLEVCDHVDVSGKRFLTEERRFRFEATSQVRILDFDQDLIASDGPVELEDRKDAGLSIRVPTSMAVDSKQGGEILSSEGFKNADAWSKKGKWCDYSGPVEGETLGVAMMSHPSTFRFPDRWHVRTYGLFTVNPFGSKVFDASVEKEEPTQIAAGERLKLRHRFVFHAGNAAAAGIEKLYEAYSKESR